MSFAARVLAVGAVAALAALPACDLYLDARSPSPPGRTARLDEVRGFWGLTGYRIELSHGVALAIACDGSCEHVVITCDAPALVEVRHAALGTLERTAWGDGPSAPSAFVLVGKAPGTTAIHVVAGKYHRDVPVTVLAPPGLELAGG